MKKNNLAEMKTKEWVENFIVKFNICPFAKKPLQENRIRFESYFPKSDQEIITVLSDELAILALSETRFLATSIVIFPKLKIDFEDFYYLCEKLNWVLNNWKLDKDFQFVVFHPDFYFEGEKEAQNTNLVNQSPYPMVHLIRSIDIEWARNTFFDLDQIPVENQKLLQNLSARELEKIKKYRPKKHTSNH